LLSKSCLIIHCNSLTTGDDDELEQKFAGVGVGLTTDEIIFLLGFFVIKKPLNQLNIYQKVN